MERFMEVVFLSGLHVINVVTLINQKRKKSYGYLYKRKMVKFPFFAIVNLSLLSKINKYIILFII